MIKTDREILDKHISSGNRSNANILDAMNEFADQFKPKWIPVSKRLPENGVRVQIGWFNNTGKWRSSHGSYAERFSIEYPWDDEQEEWLDYNPDTDTYFRPEGWQEEPYELEFSTSAPVQYWAELLKPPTNNEGV